MCIKIEWRFSQQFNISVWIKKEDFNRFQHSFIKAATSAYVYVVRACVSVHRRLALLANITVITGSEKRVG